MHQHIAALAGLAVLASAGPARASGHEWDEDWGYLTLEMGTLQASKDAEDLYRGSQGNAGFGCFGYFSDISFLEMNVSMGYGENGFYVLDLANIDAGFGHAFEVGDRSHLFVGGSPLAFFWTGPAAHMGLSLLAKLQVQDVMAEYKIFPTSYYTGDDQSGTAQYFGLHYWFTEDWSIGARYDIYSDDVSNVGLAFHSLF